MSGEYNLASIPSPITHAVISSRQLLCGAKPRQRPSLESIRLSFGANRKTDECGTPFFFPHFFFFLNALLLVIEAFDTPFTLLSLNSASIRGTNAGKITCHQNSEQSAGTKTKVGVGETGRVTGGLYEYPIAQDGGRRERRVERLHIIAFLECKPPYGIQCAHSALTVMADYALLTETTYSGGDGALDAS